MYLISPHFGMIRVGEVRKLWSLPLSFFTAFSEQAWQVQQFWHVKKAKIPNFDQEKQYLVFVSDHLARRKTTWPKPSQVDQMIQVASIYHRDRGLGDTGV